MSFPSGSVTVNNPVTNPDNVQIASLYYPSSTLNNSVAQLGSGATFTGGIETILSMQAAQIMIVCDQNYTWFIDSFIDLAGTQPLGSLSRIMLANEATDFNQQLPGNYFRIRVTNNGGSTTTTFALATTFGIMNGVDNAGNQPVALPMAKPYAGQQLATGAAVALASKRLLNGLTVTASPSNAGTIMIGGPTLTANNAGAGTGDALTPGLPRAFACDNANQIYIILATGNSSATDFVTFSGN